MLLTTAASPLAAQETPEPDRVDESEATPPTTAAPSTESTDLPPPPPQDDAAAARAEAARFAEFDKLRSQGQSSDFPGVYETITRDMGGFRTWLDDNDLYFRGVSSNNFAIDVAGTSAPRGQQTYTGQRPTLIQSNDLRLSWKVGGSGEDITQINVGVQTTVTSWRQAGPNGFRVSNLNVYSSFFDKAVEVKAGFYGNLFDFIGIFSGGNPILANGLAASIPVSTGMSGGSVTTPTVSLQLNTKNGFYSKSAVQRSLSPAGMVQEAATSGIGLKVTRRGARPLFIQEFGLRRPASEGSNQIWLRGGGTYNLTRYNRLDGQGERRNWSLFALADYQVWQPDSKQAYRGIYAGVSALFAADAVNVYTRSLEGRVYALGMIPGRPSDQMTITIGTNKFSRSGGQALAAAGQVTHRNQYSIGALYAFHAANGIFLSPSVTYIRNPSFVGDLKPALNLGMSATVLF